jgi:hypothetical protein
MRGVDKARSADESSMMRAYGADADMFYSIFSGELQKIRIQMIADSRPKGPRFHLSRPQVAALGKDGRLETRRYG